MICTSSNVVRVHFDTGGYVLGDATETISLGRRQTGKNTQRDTVKPTGMTASAFSNLYSTVFDGAHSVAGHVHWRLTTLVSHIEVLSAFDDADHLVVTKGIRIVS